MSKPDKKTRVESIISAKLNKSIISLSLLSLDRFCSKKLHEIEYISPLTVQDYDFVNQIVDTGRKYEYLSDVHFITFQDVLSFIQRLAKSRANVHLPDFVKETLENAFEYVSSMALHSESIPIDILSHMTKIKIIEAMYMTYSSEISTMQRRQKLHEELASLIKEPEAPEKPGKKGNEKEKKADKKEKKGKSNDKDSKKKDKAKKKGASSTTVLKEKSKSAVEIGDYTEITLQENEVIFDYNIDNHVQYVILSGFPDPEIFSELSKIGVTVSSIIEISQQSSNVEDLTRFVVHLHNLFETPKISRFFENTALMKYKSANDGRSSKEIFEEFLYVVKKINYIKRQHLCYLRNLDIHYFGGVPKKIDLDCLEKYNRIMNGYPPELTNIPLIIDALIEEICWRDLGPIYSLSDLSTPSTETDLDEELKYSEKIPFQVHEEDYLNLGLHCYKEIGRKYYDKTLQYLKLLKPLEEIEDSPVKTRDRTISTEQDCYCTDIKSYFDFFHLAIFSQLKQHTPFEPKLPDEYDFTLNLVTCDDTKIFQKALPKKIGIESRTRSTKKDNDVISNYHLKEDLSTSVLRQLIFKALLEYSYYDRAYCEESGAVLLRFHDNLDEFGIVTKIWNQSLRTPICLRDFCRYIVTEERKWLEEHKLKEHAKFNEDEIEEECEGLKDMHVPELYQEYQYLLEKPAGVPTEEKKRAFDEVLEEMLKYPRSDVLTSFCGMPSDDSSFTAYNLGPNRIQLTGHTIIFRSDDGVKITIDASRFLTEDPKCSLKIDADGNTLVFHRVNPSAFHVMLKDDTLIRFSKLDTRAEAINEDIMEEEVEEKEEKVTVSSKEDEIAENEEMKSELINANDHWIQILRKHKVPTVFPDFFKKISVADRKINLDGEKLNALLEVFKSAVYLNHPIYKISTKPSPYRLERTQSSLTVPLVYLVKRILFKPPRKKKKIRGYSVLFSTNIKEKEPQMYDFTINLPHGLTITTLPRNKDLVEVKQSYKYCKTSEEYRIFYTAGVILVRNSDGTTTIYRSNGDIIELTDQSETYSVNCPKNMTQIFGKSEDEVCPYKLSRCDSPIVRDDSDFFALYEFGDIPYNKKTLLECWGKKITVFDGKVTETQEYYVLSENDYPAEETFFAREDGLRCLIDRKGKRTVEFPDGTKISASPEIEKELIFVSKNPKVEGWVSVIINYKFEHPKYIPVVYDAFEKSTQIFLKDGVIKNRKDSFMMTMPRNIAVEVTAENIVFLKTCPQCDGDCICKIDLTKNASNKLLEVCDSYNKYLVCNYNGYCEINTKYIKRTLNKNKCDHRWVHEDKSLFILNSKNDPPGTILWKDGIIEKKIDECKNRKNVKFSNHVNKLTKKQTMEFFTESYQNFTGRFTTTQSYQNKICLSKYKYLNHANRLYYVTFRILTEFQNIEDDMQMLDELKLLLRDSIGIAPDLFAAMNEMLNYVFNHEKIEEERCSYRITIRESEESLQTASSKSEDLDKITVQEIITKWRNSCDHYRFLIRNRIFSGYFHSDYYHHTVSTLNTH